MRFAYLYLIVINLLDYITTRMLVVRQGFEVEANPILRHLITIADSTYPILLLKVLAVIAYGAGLYWLKTLHPERYALPIWLWVTIGIDLILTGIVVGSIIILTRL